MKQETKEKLTEYQKNKVEAEKVKIEKEAIKKQIEDVENEALAKFKERAQSVYEKEKAEREIHNAYDMLDHDHNGQIEISEVQMDEVYDINGDGQGM